MTQRWLFVPNRPQPVGRDRRLSSRLSLKGPKATELDMQDRFLYLVRYEAKPLPESESFVLCSGAAVNVWIAASTGEQALARAAQEVQEAGWSIETFEGIGTVTRDNYGEDTSGLEHFEQALIDGIVLVFHTWQDGSIH